MSRRQATALCEVITGIIYFVVVGLHKYAPDLLERYVDYLILAMLTSAAAYFYLLFKDPTIVKEIGEGIHLRRLIGTCGILILLTIVFIQWLHAQY